MCIGGSAITAIRSASSHRRSASGATVSTIVAVASARVYVAEFAETSLREVLADFRPKLSAIRRFQQEMGAEAAQELAAQPDHGGLAPRACPCACASAAGRPDLRSHRRAAASRSSERHIDLLLKHDMRHLDLHEITTSRRVVTQAIAGDLYDDGASAIRFPSSLDGNPCVAVFEGRGNVELAGEILLAAPTLRQQRSSTSLCRGASTCSRHRLAAG